MAFFKKKIEDVPRVVPNHIGIIMDGNGRWAKKRGLPRKLGHKAGAETFRNITRYCNRIGVKYLTVYAFSTENWKRPPEEVAAIMDLFRVYLTDAESYKKENVRTRFIGERSMLDEDIQQKMEELEDTSSDFTGLVLNIAINYGGRSEIVAAVRKVAQDVKSGDMEPNSIGEEDIEKYLYTAGQEEPELIIRPSGEFRTSNFLLWQSAYSEYVFMNILWPDFKPKDLEEAISIFSQRNRRFGGI